MTACECHITHHHLSHQAKLLLAGRCTPLVSLPHPHGWVDAGNIPNNALQHNYGISTDRTRSTEASKLEQLILHAHHGVVSVGDAVAASDRFTCHRCSAGHGMSGGPVTSSAQPGLLHGVHFSSAGGGPDHPASQSDSHGRARGTGARLCGWLEGFLIRLHGPHISFRLIAARAVIEACISPSSLCICNVTPLLGRIRLTCSSIWLCWSFNQSAASVHAAVVLRVVSSYVLP